MNENIKVSKHAIPIVEFYQQGKGNLTDYLRTLSTEVLCEMTNVNSDKLENELSEKAYIIAIISLAIEQGQYGKNYILDNDIEYDVVISFITNCINVLGERIGVIVFKDDSHFFDYKGATSVFILDDILMEQIEQEKLKICYDYLVEKIKSKV